MRCFLAIGALAVLLGTFAPSGEAASGVRFGIQDDAWLAHGPGTLESRLDRLESLGVDIVRFNLHWNTIEAAEGRPDWASSDEVLRGLHSRGIGAVVGLVGSPRWANGDKASNYVPTAASFSGFARAAATRYSWVREWLIWNEPNQARWLRPTVPSVYVRSLLNPGYAAIHAANPRAKVAGGVTAPRAGSAGVSPVEWIRGMRAAGARLDAYAHHPYPARPTDTPFAGGCTQVGCETITMATLERLLGEVGRAFGPKRIWLTEYAYQTGVGGVSQARQAEFLGQAAFRAFKAPRVDMLIQYLVVDEPTIERFQSGLYLRTGAHRNSPRSRSRCRSRRPDEAAAKSCSGGRSGRASARRPTGCRFGAAARGASSVGRAGRTAAATSASRSSRRAAASSGSTHRRTAASAPRSPFADARLANRGVEHDRDHDRDRDERQPHRVERAALTWPRPRLRRVRVEWRGRLAGTVVVSLEDLRLVLELRGVVVAFAHERVLSRRVASEACTRHPSCAAVSRRG
ncbi:MAG TPA: hypothetical protein VNI55_13775 [Gaiellaceae bacterium]|nr:hypothetical protein [Gaiellaceae bacterium]